MTLTQAEKDIIDEMSNETARKIFYVLKTKDYSRIDDMTKEELNIFIRLLEASLAENEGEE